MLKIQSLQLWYNLQLDHYSSSYEDVDLKDDKSNFINLDHIKNCIIYKIIVRVSKIRYYLSSMQS